MEWHTGYSIPIEGSNDIVAGFSHDSRDGDDRN